MIAFVKRHSQYLSFYQGLSYLSTLYGKLCANWLHSIYQSVLFFTDYLTNTWFLWKIRLGCHLSNQGMWAETDRRRFWVESESRIVRRASPQQATTKSASEMTIKLNDTILGGCVVDPDVIGDEKLSLKVNEQVLTKLQILGCVTNMFVYNKHPSWPAG